MILADWPDGMVDRAQVLDRLNEHLTRSPWPTRDTFGADPPAQQGHRAMMALAGGPAPLRDPDKPRPAAWKRHRPELFEPEGVPAADDDTDTGSDPEN